MTKRNNRNHQSATSPVLADRDIHVWECDLTATDDRRDTCVDLLSGDERDRAGRFRFDDDRMRWVASRAALRCVLSRYLDKTPGQIDFYYGANGKPELKRNSGGLHFSLSHAADRALIAVTRSAPVGIDLEKLRELPDRDAIAAAQFSEGEQCQLRQTPAADRSRAFFSCWTRKEAVIKATGEGLAMPLKSFEVTVDPDQPPAVRSIEECYGAISDWTLLNIETAPEYIGALAVRAPASREVSLKQRQFVAEPTACCEPVSGRIPCQPTR